MAKNKTLAVAVIFVFKLLYIYDTKCMHVVGNIAVGKVGKLIWE